MGGDRCFASAQTCCWGFSRKKTSCIWVNIYVFTLFSVPFFQKDAFSALFAKKCLYKLLVWWKNNIFAKNRLYIVKCNCRTWDNVTSGLWRAFKSKYIQFENMNSLQRHCNHFHLHHFYRVGWLLSICVQYVSTEPAQKIKRGSVVFFI